MLMPKRRRFSKEIGALEMRHIEEVTFEEMRISTEVPSVVMRFLERLLLEKGDSRGTAV